MFLVTLVRPRCSRQPSFADWHAHHACFFGAWSCSLVLTGLNLILTVGPDHNFGQNIQGPDLPPPFMRHRRIATEAPKTGRSTGSFNWGLSGTQMASMTLLSQPHRPLFWPASHPVL